MTTRPPILVVGGMTATGKTRAALELARRFEGELVGADSVQVYRGFDIGSAKPSREELGGVPHHLIDILDPDETIDAARFAERADEVIARIAERGRLPIVVGGTGLWLRALIRGLVELPLPDPTVRSRLDREADRLGSHALHARLATIDPTAASRIHPNDRVRVVRALEVFEQTGRPLGELQAEHEKGAPRYEARFFVLDRPRDALYATLKSRIAAMVEAGWADEVRHLIARFGPDVRPMRSVGYRQMLDHVLEGQPLKETERRAYQATRVYTRRQRTWFRGEPGIETVITAEELLGARSMKSIEAWLRQAR